MPHNHTESIIVNFHIGSSHYSHQLCTESPTSMTSRSRMSPMVKRYLTSQSGRGSHTSTNVAPEGAAPPAVIGDTVNTACRMDGRGSSVSASTQSFLKPIQSCARSSRNGLTAQTKMLVSML